MLREDLVPIHTYATHPLQEALLRAQREIPLEERPVDVRPKCLDDAVPVARIGGSTSSDDSGGKVVEAAGIEPAAKKRKSSKSRKSDS